MSLVQLLLHNGANANLGLQQEGDHCSLPLHIAVDNDNSELVELLLKHGADVDVTDVDGNTALHRTIHRMSRSPNSENVIPVVDILLQNKADVNKLNKKGETPLFLAAKGELLCVVDKMLECGGNANSCNSPYTSPLVGACLKQNVDLVDTLLKHGADPNVTWTSCHPGICPLFVAVDGGNIDIISLLLNAGADVNAFVVSLRMTDSITLLALATFDGEHDFIVELFRAGAEFKFLASCCLIARLGQETIPPKPISLCQAVVLAGYVPSDEELQLLQLKTAPDNSAGHQFLQQLVNWLDEERKQVPSLLRECRVVIRRQLSAAARFQSILQAIDKLPLPTALKLYVQFDGPLTEVDLNERIPIASERTSVENSRQLF